MFFQVKHGGSTSKFVPFPLHNRLEVSYITIYKGQRREI